ncbi:uncharacterized protein C12orf29 homolog [Trichechus manatus latirostris]|uniref:RNA ligase 1 n=1 Tax=Trichechus manatus latirostris TaxID=127582 RepID=A0A2Y9QE92_TRIMA|nr:uncharacterized protein C12orf29 homolog [Trichechus manatus latirostris]
MRRLGSVQRKMPCVFVTEVKEEPSAKREYQPFKVLATETINRKALDADIYSAIPTEKVDGTCCYVTTYKGQPYLWARLDRKPNKQAEKRFKKFLYSKENSKGWVPVEKNNKQYCWHSSVVNYEFEIALVLKHHPDDPGLLEISAVPLSDLLEQTLELIGTNINGNPYGLGSRKHPLHLLIPHGAFHIRNLPTLKHNDLLSWFEGCREGKIEGIVWHCNDGCLIKVIAENSLWDYVVLYSCNKVKMTLEFYQGIKIAVILICSKVVLLAYLTYHHSLYALCILWGIGSGDAPYN